MAAPKQQNPWLVYALAIGLGLSLLLQLATRTDEAERGGVLVMGVLFPLAAAACLPFVAAQVNANPALAPSQRSTVTVVAWIGVAAGVIQALLRLV